MTDQRSASLLDEPLRRSLIEAAIRAPSGDNCQPWWFRLGDDGSLLISMRPERARSFFDFHHRATFLSIGAVIENIRTEAAWQGHGVEVSYPAGESRDDPAAAIELREGAAERVEEDLRGAMLERTVNRRPFNRVGPTPEQREALLRDPVAHTRTDLYAARGDISNWAKIIYLSDRIRYSHPRIHEELFGKILLSHEEVEAKRIGLEYDRLGIGPGATAILKLLKPWPRMQKLSKIGVDAALSGQSRMLALSSGAICLVSIPGNSAENWMRAGEQIERLWVHAQQLGLSVHPMTVAPYLLQRYEEEGMTAFEPLHRPFLEGIKERISGYLDGRVGTMVFRLGHGVKMRGPAVRLPIEAFVE